MSEVSRLATMLERSRDPETAGALLREWTSAYEPPEPGSTVDDHRVRSTQSVSKPKDWEVSLVGELCRVFGCTVLWESGHSQDEDYWGKYHVVGSREAVSAAETAVLAMLKAVGRCRLSERAKMSTEGVTRSPTMTSRLDDRCGEFVDRALAYLPCPVKVDAQTVRAVRQTVAEITGRSGREVSGVVRSRRANFEIRRRRGSR